MMDSWSWVRNPSFSVRTRRSCVVSFLVVFERHVRCLTQTCAACVFLFCVFNGTLHAAWFTVVVDADEACFYSSTCWSVRWRRPCYRWSTWASRRQLRRFIFSTQPLLSNKRVSWSRVQCLWTPFGRRSLQLLSTVHAGIHRTVSCRTYVLIRRHWMFIRLDINWLTCEREQWS